MDGRTDIESRAVVSSALGATRQAISAMDEAVQWLMALVHYYGLKVG